MRRFQARWWLAALGVAIPSVALATAYSYSHSSSSTPVLTLAQSGNHWALSASSTTSTDEEGSIYASTSSTSGNTKTIYGYNVARGTTTGSPAAVYGYAKPTSITSGNAGIFGVLGRTGFNQSSGSGSAGVFGWADSTSSGYNYGVWGETTIANGYSAGVEGMSTPTSGSGYGVVGYAKSTSGRGIYGIADSSSGTTYGVYGRVSSTSGYGVYSSGKTGASGTKSAVVLTRQGPTELYAVESADVWFEDLGQAEVFDGLARVELEGVFLDAITIDEDYPLLVYLQVNGPGSAYPVTDQDGFDIVARDVPDGTLVTFRAVAKRRGYEDTRLEAVDVEDPYLATEQSERQKGMHKLSHEGLSLK